MYLPIGAPWLEEYLRQWSEFPAGKHDDMVDATSQCLNRMIYSSGVLDLPPVLTREEEMEQKERDAFLGDVLWSPYSRPDGQDYVLVND